MAGDTPLSLPRLLPNLSELVAMDGCTTSEVALDGFLARCPNLHKLRLYKKEYRLTISSPLFSLVHLRHLHIYMEGLSECFSSLSRLVSLEVLTLTGEKNNRVYNWRLIGDALSKISLKFLSIYHGCSLIGIESLLSVVELEHLRIHLGKNRTEVFDDYSKVFVASRRNPKSFYIYTNVSRGRPSENMNGVISKPRFHF